MPPLNPVVPITSNPVVVPPAPRRLPTSTGPVDTGPAPIQPALPAADGMIVIPVPVPAPAPADTNAPARPSTRAIHAADAKSAEQHDSTSLNLKRLAIVTAKGSAFPLGLLVLVLLFLLVQDRIDRKDPKLALAPVHAEPDLGFSPAPTRGAHHG